MSIAGSPEKEKTPKVVQDAAQRKAKRNKQIAKEFLDQFPKK